ncbi:MAG TPA: UbiH/UbiF family hydroxylase [Hyphomicrobiaceae bacterium]|nr:UbiH/UbiF family hydroxylase [Hyphomicrobiaceae bacterium]
MAGLTTQAVVIGAGPTGLTAALALCAGGVEVAITAPPYDRALSAADRRTTALLPGSIELLKNLGVWAACERHAAPLEGVRLVDDRGGLLRAPEVLFKAQEVGRTSFGVNIPNAALNAALFAQVSAERVRWEATSAVAVEPTEDGVAVSLAEGQRLKGALAVAADGRASAARAAAGIAIRVWNYDQTAVVTTFQHTGAHANITTELHRRAGPLTTVPLPGDASSLVWVEKPSVAARLCALETALFLAELAEPLQGLLGSLCAAGPIAAYPLSGLTAARMAQNRVALVGESAHVIPPIGAQGLNLGLRDAAVLAECVAQALARGEDIGGTGTLEAYHRARAPDVMSRTLSVDALNRSLLDDLLPLQALRGLSLHVLANIAPVRRLLMRGGLEAPGQLPHLMQPRSPPLRARRLQSP